MKRTALCILLAIASAASAGGVYGPVRFYDDVTVGSWTAISNIAGGVTSGGTYTNGAVTNYYALCATNLKGRLPVSTNVVIQCPGADATNALTLSWPNCDGISGYIVLRSMDAGSTWTNWLTVSVLATNWTDTGTNTWTKSPFLSAYPAIPAPVLPWSTSAIPSLAQVLAAGNDGQSNATMTALTLGIDGMTVGTNQLVVVSNKVGIGTATPSGTKLAIARTVELQAVDIIGVLTGASVFAHAFQDQTIVNSDNGGYASFSAIPNTTNAALGFDHMIGFQSRPSYTGSGVCNELAGVTTFPGANGPGTVSNAYGIKIMGLSGTGNVLKQYGVYVAQATRATNNYAIWTDGTTPSYFGARIGIGKEPSALLALDVKGEAWFSESTMKSMIALSPKLTGNQIYCNYASPQTDTPLILGTFAHRASQLYLNTNGSVRLGNYTTDGFLRFSGSNGTIVVDAFPSDATALHSNRVDVCIYTNTGTTSLTYTWTNPVGATLVHVLCIGGAGGGGSGACGTNGIARYGGGGGAGGHRVTGTYPASFFAATESVTVGYGGTGAVGVVSATFTNGTAGADGLASSFGATTGRRVNAGKGYGGSGGTSTAGTGGAIYAGLSTLAGGGVMQAGGGNSSVTGTGLTGIYGLMCSGGGGSGGGISAANVHYAGGIGGPTFCPEYLSTTAGGIAGGGSGTPATQTSLLTECGSGSSGGGANTNGVGGAGGSPTVGQWGAGAGGGGASIAGSQSGSGGQGAGGCVVVITQCAF